MKKLISSSFILLLLTPQLGFAQACPLTNKHLTDLRVAANKIAQQVSLSPQCQKFEEQVNAANVNLSNLANQIIEMSDDDSAYAIGDKESTALAAVAQLNNVTAVFNDKTCGKELVGFLDYADAFADMANGIAPFLALYGGPAGMPWAIGTALTATTIKSVINFFQSKTVDMRMAEQSSAFIQNSCAFYNLDIIKNSIDDIQINKFSKIEIEKEKLKVELDYLDKNKPEDVSGDYLALLDEANKDQDRIKFLKMSFQSDPLESCVYIQAYAQGQDGGLVSRVWRNYSESIKEQEFRLKLENNFFNNILNKEAQNINFATCKEFAPRWINKVESMSNSGLTYLSDKVSNQSDYMALENWSKRRSELVQNIKVIEAKIDYLHQMLGEGFDIEYSEIIRSHDQIKDTLFSSHRYLYLVNFKGLAEAWLKMKQEDASKGFREFYSKKKEVYTKIERVLKTIGENNLDARKIEQWAEIYKQHNGKSHTEVHGGTVTEICNQLRQSWASWNNGFVHSRAGRNYCITFDKVINQMDYPQVQRLCFGTSSRVGFEHNSLKNQVREFIASKEDAQSVIDNMNLLSCSAPIRPIDEQINILLNQR